MVILFFSTVPFFQQRKGNQFKKLKVSFSLTFNINWFPSQNICYWISYYLPSDTKPFSRDFHVHIVFVYFRKRNFKGSDGQNNHHQYQQNEQSPLTLTHWTLKRPLQGNPGPSWGQAHTVVGLNQLMGSQPSLFDNWIYNNITYINKW